MKTVFYKSFCACLFGFFLIAHNPTNAQTDQELIYSSYFGGSGKEYLRAVAHTPDGGVLAVGSTESSIGISTDSVHQEIFGGGDKDGVIVKLGSDFQREWVTYLGGEEIDVINDIKVLSDGSFVVVGGTNSVNGIGTPGALMPVSPGGSSAFVAKFSAAGERQWGTYFVGTGGDFPWNESSALAVDSQGNLILGSSTSTTDFPISDNAHQTTFGGASDGTITKLSSDGELIWSTYFGGSGEDRLNDMVLADNDDIVVFGYTESEAGVATTSSHQVVYGGEGDAFLARFTAGGELIWSTYYGGDSEELAGSSSLQNLARDSEGNFFLWLMSSSDNGITTLGAPVENNGFERSVVLAKFSGGGALQWGTYFGSYAFLGSGGALITCDSQVVLGGVARSSTGYLMGNPYQTEYFGTTSTGDIFLAGFSTADGQQQWGTYFGSVSSESSWSFAPVVDHRLTLVGYTHSYGMSTPDAFQPTHGGGVVDGLLSVFDLSNVTGVGEKPALQLGVYPNPARGFVRMQLPPSFSFGAEVTVFNLAGQVVAVHPQFNALEPLPLPQTPGMYVLECRNGADVVRAKVVVE